jgi:hypothetical protein
MTLETRTLASAVVVVDDDIALFVLAAGAWSLSGVVADGLADAVPLDHLEIAGDADAAPLYDISLPSAKPQAATSEPARG